MNKTYCTPLISILLPVYNAASFLSESIKSILQQTHTNLEIIVIDDGSTDQSWVILQQMAKQDRRIRLFQNKKNIGLIRTLNKGLLLCTGEYIARMDADDIAHPERLEKQVKVLQQSDYQFCGTFYQFFPTAPNPVLNRLRRLELQPQYTHPRALFFTPLIHPSLMAKTDFYRSFRYSEDFPVCEDYELFSRMLQKSDCINVLEPLMKVRLSEESVSAKYKSTQLQSIAKIYRRQFEQYSIPYTEEDLQTQLLISDSNDKQLTINDLSEINNWLIRLKDINEQQSIFDPNIFQEVLSVAWFKCCRRASIGGLELYKTYTTSPFSGDMIPLSFQVDMLLRASAKQFLRLFR
ncbi:MAG: glycosyltransferase family 2 protein [Bacteroidota bacterium]